MTKADLIAVYRSDDLQEIKNNAYTQNKHNDFMNKYGVLIEDLRL